MHNIRVTYILFSLFWLVTNVVHAETVYIIDELKIGLHKDRTVDSPIIKLVPSGTALTVIERDNDLIHVQEEAGIRGWINSKYVLANQPGKSRISALEKTNAALKNEIEALKNNPAATTSTNTNGTSKGLEQLLNSERLKVGKLQAELAAIKTNIANIDDSGALLNEIENLKQENRQLISQLESSGIEVKTNTDSEGNSLFSINSWKQLSITGLIVFILGLVAGAFILDFTNRRRHGGFRV